MEIIDGKKLAKKIKNKIVKDIVEINGGDVSAVKRPGLAIVLVGEKPDSALYVSLKEKEAKKCGIDTHTYKFDEDVEESEIKETIEFLNKDESVNAILLQLPLPLKFDTDKIIKLINPEKDVDGFHPDNLNKIMTGCPGRDNLPPLIQVVLGMIDSVKYDITDKNVCILANSDIFGKSLAKVLECKGGNVEMSNMKDKNWGKKTQKADILITAIGKKQFIKKENIKDGSLIIDIGITNENDKVFGDVDIEDVKNKVGFISPVPGGVGPMTIAIALKNTLKMYKEAITKL